MYAQKHTSAHSYIMYMYMEIILLLIHWTHPLHFYFSTINLLSLCVHVDFDADIAV